LHRLFDRFKDSPSSACPWGGAGDYRHLSARRSKQLEEAKQNKDNKADYCHGGKYFSRLKVDSRNRQRHESHHKIQR
jgi:hypothetical protein